MRGPKDRNKRREEEYGRQRREVERAESRKPIEREGCCALLPAPVASLVTTCQ
jgi:hypothetical protein